MGSFCPEASKRRKLEVEMAEDGVMELCVEYNRCVPCGRRVRVWGSLAEPDSHMKSKSGRESGGTCILSWCCTVSKSVGN